MDANFEQADDVKCVFDVSSQLVLDNDTVRACMSVCVCCLYIIKYISMIVQQGNVMTSNNAQKQAGFTIGSYNVVTPKDLATYSKPVYVCIVQVSLLKSYTTKFLFAGPTNCCKTHQHAVCIYERQ